MNEPTFKRRTEQMDETTEKKADVSRDFPATGRRFDATPGRRAGVVVSDGVLCDGVAKDVSATPEARAV